MTVHISTCGTSIAGREPMREGNVEAYRNQIQQRVGQLRQQCGDKFLATVSAETNGLSRVSLSADDEVHLLHTDTEDGEVAAQAVANIIKEDLEADVQVRRITGLQVTDPEEFARQGVPRLFEELNRIAGEGAQYRDIRLNITGGFKSVVPYITLFGLINRLPVDYLFERSPTPLSLPPAPVSFDYDLLRFAEPALRALREEGVVSKDRFWELLEGLEHADRQFLMDSLTESDGTHVTASAFAALLMQEDSVQAARVYLSKRAKAAYDLAQGSEQPALTKLLQASREPLWRKSHYHSFQGTDLSVLKEGNTQRRLAVIVRPGRLYVCELHSSHDRYESDLNGRNQTDYDLATFVEWTPPVVQAGATPLEGQEAQHERQQARMAQLKHDCSQLLEQQEANVQKVEDARKQRDAAIEQARKQCDETVATLQAQHAADITEEREQLREDLQLGAERVERLEQELRQATNRAKEIDLLRQKIPPWYRRLAAVITPAQWWADR